MYGQFVEKDSSVAGTGQTPAARSGRTRRAEVAAVHKQVHKHAFHVLAAFSLSLGCWQVD
jgi:hypothetical protein